MIGTDETSKRILDTAVRNIQANLMRTSAGRASKSPAAAGSIFERQRGATSVADAIPQRLPNLESRQSGAATNLAELNLVRESEATGRHILPPLAQAALHSKSIDALEAALGQPNQDVRSNPFLTITPAVPLPPEILATLGQDLASKPTRSKPAHRNTGRKTHATAELVYELASESSVSARLIAIALLCACAVAALLL
jgi:hypothetical protein